MVLKLVEIKEMSLAELQEQLKKSRRELVNLRMKFASRQLDNPSLMKKTKKEIARILTIETLKLREKQIEKTSEEKEEKGIKTKKLKKQEQELEKGEPKKRVPKGK